MSFFVSQETMDFEKFEFGAFKLGNSFFKVSA